MALAGYLWWKVGVSEWLLKTQRKNKVGWVDTQEDGGSIYSHLIGLDTAMIHRNEKALPLVSYCPFLCFKSLFGSLCEILGKKRCDL
jgi:hypothetical protein